MIRLPPFIPGCFLRIFVVLAAFPALMSVAAPVITLDDLEHAYDGSAKVPQITTNPPALPVQVIFRDLHPDAPEPVSAVVYDDTPAQLELSYLSYSFSAQKIYGLGNQVALDGENRRVSAVETILVTWARADEWPALAAANPDGYHHPATITIYELSPSNRLVFRAQATQSVFVPWRPLTMPNGTPYRFNGYAFRASVPFPADITLPERPLVMVSYNTQSTGFVPIGSPGPYNQLNVAMQSAPVSVGTNVDPDVILQIIDGVWFYPSSGWTGSSAPMLRLLASDQCRTSPPVDAGPWQVLARSEDPDLPAQALATMHIAPAAADVALDRLVAIHDGSPQTVGTSTVPAGLPVRVTYDGATSPPEGFGRYQVLAEVIDRNHTGSAAGELWIGLDYDAWAATRLPASDYSPAEALPGADPDGDGLPNLLEYALLLDPSTPRLLPWRQVELPGDTLAMTYRRNPDATDIEFIVETATSLGPDANWCAAGVTQQWVEHNHGADWIRATLPIAPDEPRRFMRLRIMRK